MRAVHCCDQKNIWCTIHIISARFTIHLKSNKQRQQLELKDISHPLSLCFFIWFILLWKRKITEKNRRRMNKYNVRNKRFFVALGILYSFNRNIKSDGDLWPVHNMFWNIFIYTYNILLLYPAYAVHTRYTQMEV